MATFDIFTQGIKQRTTISTNQLPEHLFKFTCFIAYRIITYCDECHDFLGERGKSKSTDDNTNLQFSLTRYKQLLLDIIDYKTRYNVANPSNQLVVETYPNNVDTLNLLPPDVDIYSFLYRITEFDCYHYLNSNQITQPNPNPQAIIWPLKSEVVTNNHGIKKNKYKFSDGTIPMLFHLLDLMKTIDIESWPLKREKY